MVAFFGCLFFRKTIHTYIICINVYLFIRNILQIIVGYYLETPPSNIIWIYFLNFVVYFLTFFCGFFSGLVIKNKSVLHASVITVLGVLFSILLLRVKLTDYMEILSVLGVGAALGCLGGCAAMIVRKLFRIYRK